MGNSGGMALSFEHFPVCSLHRDAICIGNTDLSVEARRDL